MILILFILKFYNIKLRVHYHLIESITTLSALGGGVQPALPVSVMLN